MTGHRTQAHFRPSRDVAHGHILAAAIVSLTGLALTLIVVVNVIRWSQTQVIDIATQHVNRSAATAARQSQEAARTTQKREQERIATQTTIQGTTSDIQQASLASNSSAAEQKETAWRRFYQPSAACSNPDTRPLVECANEHIRARRAFELRYKASAP